MANEADKRGSGDFSKYEKPPFKKPEAKVGLDQPGGGKSSKSDPSKNEGKVG